MRCDLQRPQCILDARLVGLHAQDSPRHHVRPCDDISTKADRVDLQSARVLLLSQAIPTMNSGAGAAIPEFQTQAFGGQNDRGIQGNEYWASYPLNFTNPNLICAVDTERICNR